MKDRIKDVLRSFFISTTLINIAIFILGSVFYPDQELGNEALLFPVIYGALAAIPSFLMYTKRELTVKQTIIREIIQAVLIAVIIDMFIFVGRPADASTLLMALGVALSVLVIYAAVLVISYFLDLKTAENLTEQLRDDNSKTETEGKQVMLLGDSLRMGYQPVVSRLMEGKANVSGPSENGRWAGYTLNSLRFWKDGMPIPDVVHWNCGLWNLGDDYGLGRPFTLPDEFVSELERTITVVHKLYPEAKLIMATIMPTDNPDSSDIESYNEIIKEVAARNDIPVDDLFPVVKENPGLIGPDHIHLTDEGYEIVAAKVVSAIEKVM